MLFPLVITQAHPQLGGPWPIFRTMGGLPTIPAHYPRSAWWHLQVSLVNDGPVTMLMDSTKLF